MKTNKNQKIEGVVSTDETRHVITMAHLEIEGEGEDRRGRLTATDGRMMVQLRGLQVNEHDTPGFVTVGALKSAKKTGELTCNGSLAVTGGPTFPRPVDGQYPNVSQVIDPLFTRSEGVKITLDAELLVAIQRGLGAEGVTLHFAAGKEFELSPILVKGHVRVSDKSRYTGPDPSGSIGVLMPMRA